MKLKIVFKLIGAALIYYLLNRSEKAGKPSSESDLTNGKKNPETDDGAGLDEPINFHAAKTKTVEKINTRHKEAPKVVKDSVDKIFGEAEIMETKNGEIKKKIFDELDNMN